MQLKWVYVQENCHKAIQNCFSKTLFQTKLYSNNSICVVSAGPELQIQNYQEEIQD